MTWIAVSGALMRRQSGVFHFGDFRRPLPTRSVHAMELLVAAGPDEHGSLQGLWLIAP